MDDMRSFEDRIADELGVMAGPEPPFDALAVARSVASQAPLAAADYIKSHGRQHKMGHPYR